MARFHCLTSKYSKQVLLKDYGNTTNYAVLGITKTDMIIKTDRRIKSEKDFIELYGFEAIHTTEEKDKALIWEQLQ